MEYWPKHIISFVLTSVISNIIFIVYLKTTNYSGGEIGMAPFVTFLNVAATLVISLIVLVCLRLARIRVPVWIGLTIFNFISTFVLFFYFRIDLFEGNMPDVNLWALLSVIIASLLIGIAVYAKKFYR